jgi:hypothetical protein
MFNLKSIPFLFILIFVISIFSFDSSLMIGSDNSWYLDMAYALYSKMKFMKDFYDYRFPVFSFFSSFIYHFNMNDYANIYIILTLVYGTYSILVYKLSLLFTESKIYSLLVSGITFLSISSRGFDAPRNICQPLFHHVLELFSIYFIWIVLNSKFDSKKWCNYILILLSGILSIISFLGRQVQLFPFILIMYFALKQIFLPKISFNNFIKYFLFYLIGVILSSLFLYNIFYLPSQYYSTLNEWLFKIPLNIHTDSMTPYQFLRRFIGIVLSVFGYFIGFKNPIIFITYTLLFYILFIKRISLISLNFYFKKNKQILTLFLFIILSHFISTSFTGASVPRYQSSVFTIHALLLSILLNYFKYTNSFFFKISSIIFIYFSSIFLNTEYKSYKISENQSKNHLFNNIIAEELSKNIILEKNNNIIVLGGQSIVGRIAKYKPFMGHFSDVTLFSQAKFEKEKFKDSLKIKIKEIDIIYKLPDYPNLDFVGEDSTNSTFIFIEKEIKENFYLKTSIKPINSHPYDYKKGAEIYIRKNKI